MCDLREACSWCIHNESLSEVSGEVNDVSFEHTSEVEGLWSKRKKVSKVSWALDPEALAELRDCKDCKDTPAVFLTAKKVPCCKFHWEKVADGMGIVNVELLVSKVEECIEGEDKEDV